MYERNIFEDLFLKNDRLIIRPFRKDDLDRFHYILSQEKVVRNLAEASKAVMKYTLEEVGLENLVALVAAENEASIRVIEKNGMQFYKIINNASEKYKNYEGHLVYRITREQYSGNNKQVRYLIKLEFDR